MPHHASNRMMAPRPRQPCEILSGMNLLNGYFKDQPSAGSRPQRRYQVAPIWPGSRILGKPFPPVLSRHENRGLSRTAFAKRFITNTARVATEIPGRRSLPKKNGATPEEMGIAPSSHLAGKTFTAEAPEVVLPEERSIIRSSSSLAPLPSSR